MSDSNELARLVGAMTGRPMCEHRSCRVSVSEFNECRDVAAFIALANHAPALIKLVRACEGLRSGPNDDFVLSKINRALVAVHAVGDRAVSEPAPDAFKEAHAIILAITSHTKHGPGESGRRGPCDTDCIKCRAERWLTENKR